MSAVLPFPRRPAQALPPAFMFERINNPPTVDAQLCVLDHSGYMKRLMGCRARLALLGVTLLDIEADDGGREYVASHDRLALTKRFRSLEEVEAWLLVVEQVQT